MMTSCCYKDCFLTIMLENVDNVAVIFSSKTQILDILTQSVGSLFVVPENLPAALVVVFLAPFHLFSDWSLFSTSWFLRGPSVGQL